jgi:hypothetical protein
MIIHVVIAAVHRVKPSGREGRVYRTTVADPWVAGTAQCVTAEDSLPVRHQRSTTSAGVSALWSESTHVIAARSTCISGGNDGAPFPTRFIRFRFRPRTAPPS